MEKKVHIEFTELLKSHAKLIQRITCIYIDSEEDRKDLRQEIYFQLWKSYATYNGDCAFSTWLYKVALNTAITYFKKDKKQNENSRHCIEEMIYDQMDETKKEQLERMYTAINNLNKLEKALVTLYLDDKTYEEITEILGITSVNARVKISRVKEKLKKIINSKDNGT